MEQKVEYKFEFVVDGEVVDGITAKTREELKGLIDSLKDYEDKFLEDNLE